MPKNCPICSHEHILFANDFLQICVNNNPHYAGYLLVTTKAHVKELTDLTDLQNQDLYRAVIGCEKMLRSIFKPDKINVASFGNMTPHIHWHIIPRFKDDLHFPNPVWGEVTHPNYKLSSHNQKLHERLVGEFDFYYKNFNHTGK